MHRAYIEGLMPVQMSYSGRNFDIVTGVTARPAWRVARDRSLVATVGPRVEYARRSPAREHPRRRAAVGARRHSAVFMNEPANVWITHAPWVWLPTVMVFAAIFGHVAVYRRLAAS